MALFKQHREMDEQIKIEFGYMRIAHHRNSINAQSGRIIEAHAGSDCRTGESVMSDELSAWLLSRIRIDVYAPFAKRGWGGSYRFIRFNSGSRSLLINAHLGSDLLGSNPHDLRDGPIPLTKDGA